MPAAEPLPPLAIPGKQQWHRCVRCLEPFLSNVIGKQYFCMNCRPVPFTIKKFTDRMNWESR